MEARSFDLSAFSSRGITRRDRALAVGVTFFIPVVVGMTIPLMFYSRGVNAGTGLIAVIGGTLAAFNLGLGFYALRVTRAPGAERIGWDREALRLTFPSGREDVYQWVNPSMRISVFLMDDVTSPTSPGTFVRSSWRPPSVMPREVALQLTDFARSHGLTPIIRRETLRFYGPATVNEIHGSRSYRPT